MTGFLVRRSDEWGRRLRELVNDAAMREEMGAAARTARDQPLLHDRRAGGEWERAYQALLGSQTDVCRQHSSVPVAQPQARLIRTG